MGALPDGEPPDGANPRWVHSRMGSLLMEPTPDGRTPGWGARGEPPAPLDLDQWSSRCVLLSGGTMKGTTCSRSSKLAR